MRRKLKGWRKGLQEERVYKEEKREYKELCERKKEEEHRRWEKEVETRTEKQVCKVIKRERRRWRGINEEIGIEELKEYFMALRGVENRMVRWGEERGKTGESELSK